MNFERMNAYIDIQRLIQAFVKKFIFLFFKLDRTGLWNFGFSFEVGSVLQEKYKLYVHGGKTYCFDYWNSVYKLFTS